MGTTDQQENLGKKLVVVLTGTHNQNFMQYLIRELHDRQCSVTFVTDPRALFMHFRNRAVVGVIIDDFNPIEMPGVEECLRILHRTRPEPITVVLKPPSDSKELDAYEDKRIWIHGDGESMDPCLDHVAYGKVEVNEHVS